jgi:pilus assembly protein CpaF
MFLRKRSETGPLPASPAAVAPAPVAVNAPSLAPAAPPPVEEAAPADGLKRDVLARLLEEADAGSFRADMPTHELEVLLRRLITEAAQRRDELLGQFRLEKLVAEVLDEIRGLGPLEPLLRDPAITEIMVNSPHQIYVEREGLITLTNVRFENDQHLLRVIDRVVSRIGRHIDESSPMCDARLPDGSRVNAIVPPLALNGPCMTIRRFGRKLGMPELMARGALTEPMALFLRRAVEGKLNILVSGGTGSGKTTVLNALSCYIPAGERLVTIEDAAELQLQQPHVIRLETRQANTDGQGAITQADLLKNTLRMRPDRIVVGEVRGGEALAMLQAMNTGHEGSLTTVHANTCRDALSRLETMVLMSGVDLPHRVVRDQIASAIDIVVQVERSADGKRRITQIAEMTGMEGETYLTQDLFRWVALGRGPDGAPLGRHEPTGIVPRCMGRLEARGYGMPVQMFQPGA